jgi:hypothetical protein
LNFASIMELSVNRGDCLFASAEKAMWLWNWSRTRMQIASVFIGELR